VNRRPPKARRPQKKNPGRFATGVRRRVIEGEGLGGFARRYIINFVPVIWFRRRQQIFCLPDQAGFWPEIA
jgi:hypothetical protein